MGHMVVGQVTLSQRTSWLEEFFIAQAQVYVNHKPQKL